MLDEIQDWYADCAMIYNLVTDRFIDAKSGTARRQMYENGHNEKQPPGSYSITLGHTFRGYISPTKNRKRSQTFKSLFETKYFTDNRDVFYILKEFVDKYRPNFEFTEVQINYNWKSPKHKDKANQNNSLIIGLGDYTGGELIIDKDDDGCSFWEDHDINCKFLQFNGGKYTHWVKPWEGERLTLVFYNLKAKKI